ncbi:ubiquitin-activating E1 FCCH domain-containing protein [Reyranella sp.]|uniref:ubiquitin-activating E1 FCCH domain-containing protein n=1 Tax=Reyranella sp. TaxID=1929291 RepID=UPI0027301D58|nr:ubiquitin-activating E1 FCCH domain-containing protein [Reyranella sp.]MDP2376413.1 ubiquitin-activating E1 FCCH domain-containing protein [Reyranella sp.]
MPSPLILPSFAAGEISPALHGRVDLAKYQVGLATCLNWFIHPFGGASTRAGTEFVGEAVDPAVRSRLIPFQFNTAETYALEFAHQKMRVIRDGGYVLEPAIAISGITRANPGIVTTTVPHGLGNGDHVWIDGVVGMSEINGRRFTVAGAAATTFELSDTDTSAWNGWTSGGTVARFYTLATPYASVDLPLLKFVQSADTMTLTHPGYAPRNLTRTGHTSWTLIPIVFAPATSAPTGLASTNPGGAQSYVLTAVNDENGEESLASATVGAADAVSGIVFTPVVGCTYYNVYKHKNGIYGFIGRVKSGSTFTDTNIVPDTSDTPPIQRNPFTAAGDWPGCSTWHDGRQWFARTDKGPQTLWASQSANFKNMSVSEPTRDSDAITRTIASREVNEIRFLLSLNSLLVFTSGGEWKCWAGSQSDIITPANTSLKPQGYTGISHVPPIVSGNSALFVTPSGRKVRDLAYDLGADSWQGKDVGILAGHLFEGAQVEEWALARDPDSIVWCVRSDGVLLGFTYLKEHDVYAWSRHITDGTVESVCAVQEESETALYASIRRKVAGATVRYVERLRSRLFADVADAWCVDSGVRYDGWNGDPARTLTLTGAGYAAGDAVALSALGHAPFSAASVGTKYILRSSQSQTTVTVTAYIDPAHASATLDYAAPPAVCETALSDWAPAAATLSGLRHLEGRTVAILADGSVQPSAIVTNGAVSVPRPAGRILAGLPYTCDLETLDLEASGAPTLQGRVKRVQEVVLRVRAARGLAVGPDPGHLTEVTERATEAHGAPTLLATGDKRVLIDPSWNSNGRVFVRQAWPLPATIVAIVPRLEIGE